MNCNQLVPQGEERYTLGTLEFLAVGDRECRALAADDFDVVLVCDMEAVPREGPNLLLHDESGLLGADEAHSYAQGRVNIREVDVCHFVIYGSRIDRVFDRGCR